MTRNPLDFGVLNPVQTDAYARIAYRGFLIHAYSDGRVYIEGDHGIFLLPVRYDLTRWKEGEFFCPALPIVKGEIDDLIMRRSR